MDPKNALEMLYKTCDNIALSGQDHRNLNAAYNTLFAIINPEEHAKLTAVQKKATEKPVEAPKEKEAKA